MSKVVAKVAAVATKVSTNKGFENPYRPSSSYAAIVEVIASMGMNKFHPVAAIIKAFPKAMGEGFAEFKARKPRNENGKASWEDRVVQNAIVICRPDKYGDPLREIAYEARKTKTETGYSFGIFNFSGKASTAKASKATVKASKAKTAAVTAPKAKKPRNANKAVPKASKKAPKAK